jgi:predicted TIM-barrel fold metal-dependent hydrolase
MTYAAHRTIIDADSHVIELEDFLFEAAEPAERAVLPAMDSQQELPVRAAGLARGRELFAKRRDDPAVMAKFEEKLLDNSKSGWNRIGAFDPKERSHCLDLLGFKLQLILPTFAFHQVAHSHDPNVLRVGSRVLNRAMGRFCAADERMKAIGYVPLSLGPEEAGRILDEGLAAGCYTFMVDTNQPDNAALSFTHPDFDPVWSRFEAAGAPFVVHVAVNGEYRAVSPSFRNNGRQTLELGGDAPSGELGLLTIGNSAQIFLSAMIFDGVFERHPGLRGISMEHAAFWLPSWLHGLDYTAKLFRGHRGRERPSDVVRRHLTFCPFAGEPVGWIIENVGPELLAFASDYPHPEGTSDPIAKFEASMTKCDSAAREAFFHANMETLMGIQLSHAASGPAAR